MAKDTIDRKKLKELVNRLGPDDDHYRACFAICAELDDGEQKTLELLHVVMDAITERLKTF